MIKIDLVFSTELYTEHKKVCHIADRFGKRLTELIGRYAHDLHVNVKSIESATSSSSANIAVFIKSENFRWDDFIDQNINSHEFGKLLFKYDYVFFPYVRSNGTLQFYGLSIKNSNTFTRVISWNFSEEWVNNHRMVISAVSPNGKSVSIESTENVKPCDEIIPSLFCDNDLEYDKRILLLT